jgi:hypothetical protein
MSGAGRADDAFFVGWAPRLPRGLGGFLALVAGAALAGMALAAVLLSAGVDDPGGGDFNFAAGERTLRGTLVAEPYPVLILPPDAAHPRGHAVLLSGLGKSGVEADPALAAKAVDATGLTLKRGALDMMQVGDAPGLRAADGVAATPVDAEPLGRWRITGEICDGKCWIGAMRPGSGVAHRACASLCLVGGIPPVFVATGPVEGSSFLLLAGADGGRMPEALLRLVGLRVRLDGEVERRGDLLIFRADPSSAEVL